MKSPENEFYLRDMRSNVGTSCTFWAKDGRGYTSDLDRAEVFDHAGAQEHADRGGHFIPLSKQKVDVVAVLRVDMQRLRLSADFSEGVVVQRYLGSYDGNDIFFDDGCGGATPDYDKAKVYEVSELEALENQCGAVHTKKFLDTICRRIIQTGDVNRRKMVTSAGIRYRSPRRRATTGKYRGNCPTCGRITWGYFSDFNEYCERCEMDRY